MRDVPRRVGHGGKSLFLSSKMIQFQTAGPILKFFERWHGRIRCSQSSPRATASRPPPSPLYPTCDGLCSCRPGPGRSAPVVRSSGDRTRDWSGFFGAARRYVREKVIPSSVLHDTYSRHACSTGADTRCAHHHCRPSKRPPRGMSIKRYVHARSCIFSVYAALWHPAPSPLHRVVVLEKLAVHNRLAVN